MDRTDILLIRILGGPGALLLLGLVFLGFYRP